MEIDLTLDDEHVIQFADDVLLSCGFINHSPPKINKK